MTTVVVVVSVLLVIGVVVWFALQRRHPENAASHESRDASSPTESHELYDGVDRPAGPGAETMNPDALGGDQQPPS